MFYVFNASLFLHLVYDPFWINSCMYVRHGSFFFKVVLAPIVCLFSTELPFYFCSKSAVSAAINVWVFVWVLYSVPLIYLFSLTQYYQYWCQLLKLYIKFLRLDHISPLNKLQIKMRFLNLTKDISEKPIDLMVLNMK